MVSVDRRCCLPAEEGSGVTDRGAEDETVSSDGAVRSSETVALCGFVFSMLQHVCTLSVDEYQLNRTVSADEWAIYWLEVPHPCFKLIYYTKLDFLNFIVFGMDHGCNCYGLLINFFLDFIMSASSQGMWFCVRKSRRQERRDELKEKEIKKMEGMNKC